MNIVWQYLDKRSAAISALKDYGSMAYILEHTGEDIALVQDRMTAPRASVLTGMPSAPTVFVTPSTALATPRRPKLSKGLAKRPAMSLPPKDIE